MRAGMEAVWTPSRLMPTTGPPRATASGAGEVQGERVFAASTSWLVQPSKNRTAAITGRTRRSNSQCPRGSRDCLWRPFRLRRSFTEYRPPSRPTYGNAPERGGRHRRVGARTTAWPTAPLRSRASARGGRGNVVFHCPWGFALCMGRECSLRISPVWANDAPHRDGIACIGQCGSCPRCGGFARRLRPSPSRGVPRSCGSVRPLLELA